MLNVNPPNSREGSKRARKIDHKPSAVRSKVFFISLESFTAGDRLFGEVEAQTYAIIAFADFTDCLNILVTAHGSSYLQQ